MYDAPAGGPNIERYSLWDLAARRNFDFTSSFLRVGK
jgi:hypothetical protein